VQDRIAKNSQGERIVTWTPELKI